MQESYLKGLYEQYLAEGDNISDEGKIKLMRDALQIIEVGDSGSFSVNSDASKSDSSFPAFYALDMIQFGLTREIPAAIRLGELLL